MAAVIHELWMSQDKGLLIMPGSLPMDVANVRDELTRHLSEEWNGLVDKEVDGRKSIPYLLDKEIESYGLISVTEKGLEFLDHPYTLMLTEEREFSEGEDDDDENAAAANRGGGGGDTMLLSMLKDLRRSVARRLGLQPWVIFSDASLEDMSILYPVTYDELKNCQGVGDGKARKFGKEFIELIGKYVQENEIDRPDDFVVKSTVNKSANKVFIIQSIDRKLSLDDIADAAGLEMDELIDEIDAIVYSGTRLDIGYYINENIDDDTVADIYGYFREDAESDSLQEAMEELGPDYDERDVRLVRIKFLCEVAN